MNYPTPNPACEFANVYNEKLNGDWRKGLMGAYLHSYFSALRNLWGPGFEELRFLVISANTFTDEIHFPIEGDSTVLVWLGDEAGTIPDHLCHRFRLILKSYYAKPDPHKNIHPFPLCVAPKVLNLQPIDFQKREINVFFSGHLTPHRVDFYRHFLMLGRLRKKNISSYTVKRSLRKLINSVGLPRRFDEFYPNSMIRFTHRFGDGLSEHDYAAALADTKIAICPGGFWSIECIRHFEAMRMGCIIISDCLPPNRLYSGSPIIQLERWSDLSLEVNRLLGSPQEMLDISTRMTRWWEDVCSPEAMAKYTVEVAFKLQK